MSMRTTRCDDCKRVMSQNKGKNMDDAASQSLLQPNYDSEEGGDAGA